MARVCIFEEARSQFLEIYLTWYFPNEPLIMALPLSQHKIIEWLTDKISRDSSLTRGALLDGLNSRYY